MLFMMLKLVTQVLGDKFNPPTKVKSAVIKLELKEKVNKKGLLVSKTLGEKR